MKRVLLGMAVVAAIVFAAIALLIRQDGQAPQHPGTPVVDERPRFKFVVLSDLAGRRPRDDTVLAETVTEINLLDPDFAICVGNLVPTDPDSDSPEKIDEAWDRFKTDIEKLTRPFYYVFGSRDAEDPAMIDLLRKRFGALHYSFDYPIKGKGDKCHFIVLFTETCDAKGERVGLAKDREQFSWLRRDLMQNDDAVHTFVFMNRPELPDEVLKLFAGRPTTVFTGFEPRYRQFEKAGVNVYVLGATGPDVRRDLYAGGLRHYMLVTVSGEKVLPAIVRVGAIYPNTFLSEARLAKIAEAREKVRKVSLKVPKGISRLGKTLLTLTIPNPLETPITVDVYWRVPRNSPWTVGPSTMTVQVPVNSETRAGFELTCSTDPTSVRRDLMPTCRVIAPGGCALIMDNAPRSWQHDGLYDYTTPLSLETE